MAECSDQLPSYDIVGLTRDFSEAERDVWYRYGWLMSNENNLSESDDKSGQLICINTVMAFLRSRNLHLGAFNEVKIAKQIGQTSRIKQGLSPRNP